MASTHDHVCDLTGEVLSTSDLPVVVRIQVAVVPGALVDPAPETLPPFIRRMLFHPDGRPRAGRLELGARAFTALFPVGVAALEPAFLEGPTPAEQLLIAHAEIARLRAALQRGAAQG